MTVIKRKTISITGADGRIIPCIHTLTGDEDRAVLIFHGFGSSKESPTAELLAEVFPRKGLGTLAIDFPAHGDSPADGTSLTLAACLADMKAAEQELKRLAPKAKPAYFGSSFGAYMTILYLASGQAEGRDAFLRSAAVEMPKILREKIAPDKELLERQGYLMADENYRRPLKLARAFFRELDENDVFSRYKKGTARLHMIHGTLDETASFEAAKRFAEGAGAGFTALEGGDHRLSLPGMPEKTAELAAGFFLA